MFENLLKHDDEKKKKQEKEKEEVIEEKNKIDLEKEKIEKENKERIKKLANQFYKENKNNLALAICYLFHGQTKYFLETNLKK